MQDIMVRTFILKLMLSYQYMNFSQCCDTLQVSPDTDSLISNGYHNNLKMSQSCDFLP